MLLSDILRFLSVVPLVVDTPSVKTGIDTAILLQNGSYLSDKTRMLYANLANLSRCIDPRRHNSYMQQGRKLLDLCFAGISNILSPEHTRVTTTLMGNIFMLSFLLNNRIFLIPLTGAVTARIILTSDQINK